MQRGFNGEFPKVTPIKRMAHIVVRRTVSSAQIVWVLRTYRERLPSPVGKRSGATIRYFIKCMRVGVIGLEQPLAPATKSVLQRNHHAVVVGNTFCIELLHFAESRIRRAVWNWNG